MFLLPGRSKKMSTDCSKMTQNQLQKASYNSFIFFPAPGAHLRVKDHKVCRRILGRGWPSLRLCWHLLGLCGPSLWSMLGHLGDSGGYVGPASAHFGAYVGPCWPIFIHKIEARCSPRTRMQSCRTLLWNKLIEQSIFFPCYRTSAQWTVECGRGWGAKCGVWSVKWRVRSVKCGV